MSGRSNRREGGASPDGTATNIVQDLEVEFGDPPPLPEDLGATQRLRIHVPTPEGAAAGNDKGTTLSLGYRIADTAYTGAGVETWGHVLVNAVNGLDDSTMSLQANGQVLLQTDAGNLYVFAKGDALVGSTNSVNVGGKKGVVVIGGHGPEPTNPAASDEVPPAPLADDAYTGSYGTMNDLWSTASDYASTVMDTRSSVRDAADGAAWSSFDAPKDLTATLAAQWGALGTENASWDEYNSEARTPHLEDGVSIYGEAGVLAASPQTIGIWGDAGVHIGSSATAVMLAENTEILGNTAFKATAGESAAVSAGTSCEVTAGTDVTIGAREGALTMDAPDIQLGHQSPTPDTQKPTKTIALDAAEKIALTSLGDSGGGIDALTDGELVALGKKKVKVSSTEKVVIYVGSFAVEIKTDKITIGKCDSEGGSPSEPLVEIKEDGILVGLKDKTGLVVKKDSVAITKGGSKKIELGSSGKWKVEGDGMEIL